MRTAHLEVTRKDARGFTLIELMVAMLIGVFLLGALVTIVQTNRTVFGDQNKQAQLQDAERMALTMMSDVIEAAGYFPNPSSNTLTGSLTAAGSFAAGQAVYGTYSAAAPGDTVSIRYMTANGDGILNCSGLSNTSGGNVLYTNTFQVVAGQLVCTMNGTNYTLVGGGNNFTVTNLSVLYGVKANAAAAGNSVDTYMTADWVTNKGLWDNVISALIKLTFTNPMYTASNGQPQYLTIQRVVTIMNQAGPVE